MGECIEWCPYAVLCRIPTGARASAPPVFQSASELLVAIANRQLHVFFQRLDRVPSSCACDASGLRKHGFICPHIKSYDDYAHALTIPTNTITQVFMTYRTAAAANTKSVATRTKDLVLKVQGASSALLLWLEFEHNLARGWFLESLMAAATSPQIDVDYLDLSDANVVETLQKSVNRKLNSKDFAPKSPMSSTVSAKASKSTDKALGVFLRDAWRHIIYEKIKLTLQISHDNPASIDSEDDPMVACLLTTAMELSTRLDEPDLDAFTWLTSGFLNMQSTSPAKEELALAQIQHSLRLTRENSLVYLSCLALQCAGDYTLHRREDAKQAREMLTEATKLLTVSDKCGAMEPPLKMRLHAMLRELTTAKADEARPSLQRAHSTMDHLPPSESRREQFATAPRSGSSSSLMSKSHKAMSFSLWAHVFGSGFTSSSNSSRRGSCDANGDSIKKLLLHRVEKADDNDAKACFVDVLGPHGARKARFRVFYTAQTSFSWLQEHIGQRYDVVRRCLENESDQATHELPEARPEPVRVELFYDPQRKQLVPSLETTRLSQWISSPTNAYELHAKLSLSVQSSHRSSVDTRPVSPRCASTPALIVPRPMQPAKVNAPASETAPSVLCSLCGHHILLDDVEDHSETCF